MDSQSVLEIFKEITRIPRESGHEEKMTAFLQKFAADRGLGCKTDATGNVVITREAAPGKENVPAIVLQSHQDMVCEKNSGCDHDFARDPISYVIEDGWMIAKDTTLGADDGIGVAASLALLDSDIPTGKLECLFTISEETGMDGANAIESGLFTAKTLINLDSEDEGQLFVGCAGGVDTTAVFKYVEEGIDPSLAALKLRVFNAIGGHSGDDINKERANTVQILARFLYGEYSGGYRLVSFNGGNKRNAIAREAEAVILLDAAGAKALEDRFGKFAADVKAEYHRTDPDISFECIRTENPGKAVDKDTARRFIFALTAVNHGVLTMSQDIAGLVETSTNLAAVFMNVPGEIKVTTSQRSSTDSAKKFMADKVEAAFLLAGAEVSHSDPYPGWTPNMDSHILDVTVASYRKLFGVEPEVKAIHAGLECGLFLTKFPDLDMISFGPTLRGVHAPGEKLNLESNEKFVKLLVDVVTNFR
ncbi:MAG: aminoacyl-histidine dipeptidase [Bacteroidales bacterium]|nr:aminoacyl-histidine dipeptidase [Bacteroidales bacterium]MDY2860420.1 aminoacyl-histidine dipeptidase [Candidatus Cryptobacteroides sp.]MDY5443482.1 aminoacyl-histidine dipeptidase [Candidatus Cryptobacteroides sp.]